MAGQKIAGTKQVGEIAMVGKTALITVMAAILATAGRAQDSLLEDAEDSPGNPLEQVLQAETVNESPELLSGFKDAFVTLAVTPRYPKRALRKKIDGEVTLEFDISKHGRAENITVVAESPPGVFKKEAADALQYWAFSPARLATCGTLAQRARQTLRFDHGGDPQIRFAPLMINDIPQPPQAMEETTLQRFRQEQVWARQASGIFDSRNFVTTKRVEPDYPLKALERRKEGMVAIAFIIETDGSVADVEVVDSVAATYFQRSSLTAIRQWTFRPKLRDGKPIASAACHEFIFHADEYARSGKLSRAREDANIRTYTVD
ncbi:MAG: energy transducer TonB [Gammaproteobacteria bacterium]|nr:MAG: energy transducer TonB [Gammaproteobacteria bacterium]